LGRALTTAVSTYNQTVGSLEGRVLVTARRLNELGVVDAELAAPAPVEQTARALSAPELTGTEPAEIEPAGNRAAENGSGTIDHRVSLVRAAR
jgi:DNA recombination protein RmuC